MRRERRILEHISRDMRGIEIGPGHAPLCPKRDGWNVLTLDVFDTDELRRRAADPATIEPVDLVGAAHDLAVMAPPGDFDFIVSSHNFEHLPDPVRFLRAAEDVLRPGGVVSMAVPDHRRCFDTFRPASTLGDILEAFVERRDRPTPRQVFDSATMFAAGAGVVSPSTPVASLGLERDIGDAWREWLGGLKGYKDAHCWLFTPARCELILRDLRYLGLTGLEVISVSPTVSHEFFIHLRKPVQPGAAPSREEHHATRVRLMRAAWIGG